MKKKFFLICLIFGLFIFNLATAAKIDIYRNALHNKQFTLKYSIETIPIIQTRADAYLSSGGLNDKFFNLQYDFPHKGIIVENGDNRYFEVYHDGYVAKYLVKYDELTWDFYADFHRDSGTEIKTREINPTGVCNLIKDGEVTEFFWVMNDGEKNYNRGVRSLSGHLGIFRVGEPAVNFKYPYKKIIDEINFGNPEIAGALLPILPAERILVTAQTLNYKFFDSGKLANGLTFEDFVADTENIYSAIRYYFEGDKLVKIARATYFKDEKGIKSYEKSVIKILEFKTTPDESYLSLPESISKRHYFLEVKG